MSILPYSSILPCPPCFPPVILDPPQGTLLGETPRGSGGERGSSGGEGGFGGGGGGRGHFIHPAIYCCGRQKIMVTGTFTATVSLSPGTR